MSSDLSVVFDRVTKQFPVESGRTWRAGLPWTGLPPAEHAALHEVTLQVPRGQALGVIGPNGAGKSTLLKLLAGVLTPTAGDLRRTGRIGAMIELGLGFHPDLTGRENITCSGALLGLGRDELLERTPAIIEFAGLADVIDQPLRSYSSGMVARLGFATATHVDADVLVVDEVLSVGDREFQEKCLERIAGLVATGTTLLFVSHELHMVEATCERVVMLRDGHLVDDGAPSRVIESYVGRRTAAADAGAPAAAVRRLELTATTLDHNDPITFDADIEVLAADRVGAVEVSLSLPSIDPDLVIVASRTPAPPDLRRPGRLSLRGTSTPIPLVGGRLRVNLVLLSDTGTALGTAHADLSLRGPIRLAKPTYPLGLTAQLTPAATSAVPREPVLAPRQVQDPVASVRGLRKSFPSTGTGRVGAGVPGRGRHRGRRLVALDDVALDVARGESLGVIGPNGAGKSTLLRCIAGVSDVDAGTIDIAGRTVAMLELGVGFQADVDGWENLRATALLLGLHDDELEAVRDTVVEFSGVLDAMDQPIKHWSTGMRARLGFALATHVPCDLLLIDEVLAVGDLEFRRQAVDRLREVQGQGTAVIFVSHDLDLVAEVCDSAVRLERGRVVDQGKPHPVIEGYGGKGWSGGSALGTSGIHLHGLSVTPDRLTGAEPAMVSALVEVAEPAPHVRLELSIRDPSGRSDASAMTAEQIEMFSIGVDTAAPEGALASPGWYSLEGSTGMLIGHGEFHMVLSAVDTRDGVYLAEAWTTIHVAGGRRGAGELPGAFRFDVALERVAAGVGATVIDDPTARPAP